MIHFKKMAEKFLSHNLKQFIRFCIVGFFGVLIWNFVYIILYKFLLLHYIVSSAIGFIVSVFYGFFFNKRFTFNIGSERSTGKLIVKYFMVNLFSLFLGMVALAFFVEILKINVYISNFLILGVTTTSNFTGSKMFAFR